MRPDIGDIRDGIPFPCGQCLACRINKRRVWTLRLLLESYLHETASFVTLTYSDDDFPFSEDGRPILCKRDLQLFLKRLRKRFGEGIRFYAAGEYGSKTLRPHYHIILFGVGPSQLDPDWFYFNGKSGPFKPGYCRETTLYQLWQHGIVHIGEVTRNSIQYVAGYVTKKITKKGDGLAPEFQLMSRRPGIGSGALTEIARAVQEVSEDCTLPDAGKTLRIDGKDWPLGRFLLSKLRIVTDASDGIADYVLRLRDDFKDAQRTGYDFLEYIVEKDDQAFVNLETRQSMFHPRKDL